MANTIQKESKIIYLQIGQNYENLGVQKQFDVSEWTAEFPGAHIYLLFKRPGEEAAAPVNTTLDEDGILTWTVSNWETGIIGIGFAEIRAIDSSTGLVKKSHVIPCSIEASVTDEDAAPDYPSWVDRMLQFGENVDSIYATLPHELEEGIASIQQEAQEQTEAIEQKGITTRASIPADYTTLSDEVTDLKSALTSSIDYLANSEQMRVYPVWESGDISEETGDDVTATNSVRCGYIDKNAVAFWNVETHTSALYVYRYNYTDGVYTYLGFNQMASAGNFTRWLKSLAGTHLRFVSYQANVDYPNTWMTLCYSTQIGKDIESLKTTQTKTDAVESNLGYWRQYLEIPAGSGHSGYDDILPVDIKAGQAFMLRFSMNKMYGIQIYALYADGTTESVLARPARDFPYAKSLYHISPKSKDIVGLSQYAVSANTIRTCVTEVITDDSISDLIGYSRGGWGKPYIQMESERLYFETGRARYDVDNIHQSIAVWNDQVWEFGEGKATYNGIVYELENGHGNTCNWGITLHGQYPYLYCPTWVNNETKINVFTFDGSAFTLDHVIDLNLSGYMDAYVDELSERIYAFTYTNNRTGAITYTVADLSGNILSTKEISYRIPVIQGMCLHNGVLYVTSGFATQEFPNYLNLVSTDGTLLGRYGIYGIGEIEGIDFMDNEMILASYYEFYIHPTKLPKPFRLSGIFDQLEATT